MRPFSVPDLDLAPRDLSKLKVLVVDDYADAAETLADFISLSGHHVLTAFDGATALEIADRTRPNVILMELTLPRISGLDVCRRLKSTTWGTKSKIVAVTGWSVPSRIAESREAGFDGHMLKPIDCRELERLLGQLSADKSSQSKSRPPWSIASACMHRSAAPLPLLR
jgi:DNA-binding response OmpR family regulator